MKVRNLGEMGVNLQKIYSRLTANQDLLKLLYYTDKNPAVKANLTETQIKNEIYNKLLLIVPYIPAEARDDATSKVSIRVMNGITNSQNDEFKNIRISLEIFVPMTQWLIKDSNLRPFAIMGEIQKSLCGKNINGMGTISGGDFSLSFLTEEMSCYQMDFSITQYD